MKTAVTQRLLVTMTKVVVLLLVALCGPASAQTQAGLLTIHIATSSDEVLASILYARNAGLFKAAGLDVQVEKQNSGAAIAAAVTSGTYDLGTSSIISLLNARRRGVLFTIVAPGAAYDARQPISELLVLKDSPIRSARDLDGKIVGIQSLSDLDTIATRAWADEHGGDSKTIQFVEMPMSAKAAALEGHRLDAAIVGQPFLTQALDTGKMRVLSPALTSIAPRFSQSAWFTTPQWAAVHADAIARFRRAVDKANAYTNEHHAEVAAAVSEVLRVPSIELHGTLGTTLTERDIQPVIDVAEKYHVIDRTLSARDLLAPAAR